MNKNLLFLALALTLTATEVLPAAHKTKHDEHFGADEQDPRDTKRKPIEESNDEDFTPECLFDAVLNDDIEYLRTILRANPGIDVNVRHPETGDTPLHIAADMGYDDIVAALLAMPRIDVNARSRDEATPLDAAANNGKADTIRLLIAAHSIIVNTRDAYSDTPLHTAASRGNKDAVDELLEAANIEIDAQTESGNTALHIAAKAGYDNIVKSLLRKTANRFIRNNQGQIPFDVATIESIRRRLNTNIAPSA